MCDHNLCRTAQHWLKLQSKVPEVCIVSHSHRLSCEKRLPLFAGEGVDPAVMQEVAKMVAQSCSTCSKAMRAEGIKVQFSYQLVSVLQNDSCRY